MHNAVLTCASDTVDSEMQQHFLVAYVPRYMQDAGEACMEALHSSAEVDTDEVLDTGGLLHLLGVPLAPESASALQLQRAKVPNAVVFTNYQGLAPTVSPPYKALAE
jgi:hypothetical protein